VTASILLVCRANLCRSPSAEVMLSRALADADVAASVASAGMEVVDGQAPPEDFVEIALVRGIDLRAHRPTSFSKEAASDADLVLTMTRDLLRTMVLSAPAIWGHSFTLLELVRRATSSTPPEEGETLRPWVARVHGSRDRAELTSLDPIDDLRDPMVDATESNELMFGELERATRRLARILAALSA
jgi:protein-tyrosine phosphatase